MINVTAAILIKNDKVLIAKRLAGDKLGNKWEFPGGKIEEGETPEQSLRREMKEELNIEVLVGDFIGESIYHYDHGSIKLLAYRVFWEHGVIFLSDHEEYQWAPIDMLNDYDFAPADLPFVEKLRRNKYDL